MLALKILPFRPPKSELHQQCKAPSNTWPEFQKSRSIRVPGSQSPYSGELSLLTLQNSSKLCGVRPGCCRFIILFTGKTWFKEQMQKARTDTCIVYTRNMCEVSGCAVLSYNLMGKIISRVCSLIHGGRISPVVISSHEYLWLNSPSTYEWHAECVHS